MGRSGKLVVEEESKKLRREIVQFSSEKIRNSILYGELYLSTISKLVRDVSKDLEEMFHPTMKCVCGENLNHYGSSKCNRISVTSEESDFRNEVIDVKILFSNVRNYNGKLVFVETVPYSNGGTGKRFSVLDLQKETLQVHQSKDNVEKGTTSGNFKSYFEHLYNINPYLQSFMIYQDSLILLLTKEMEIWKVELKALDIGYKWELMSKIDPGHPFSNIFLNHFPAHTDVYHDSIVIWANQNLYSFHIPSQKLNFIENIPHFKYAEKIKVCGDCIYFAKTQLSIGILEFNLLNHRTTHLGATGEQQLTSAHEIVDIEVIDSSIFILSVIGYDDHGDTYSLAELNTYLNRWVEYKYPILIGYHAFFWKHGGKLDLVIIQGASNTNTRINANMSKFPVIPFHTFKHPHYCFKGSLFNPTLADISLLTCE